VGSALSYAVLPRDVRRIKIKRPRLSGASVQKKDPSIPVIFPSIPPPLFKIDFIPIPLPFSPASTLGIPHGEFISSAASHRRRNIVRVLPVGWCSGGDNVDEVARKSTLLRRRFLDGVRSCIAGAGARDRCVCCGGLGRRGFSNPRARGLCRAWAAFVLVSPSISIVLLVGGASSFWFRSNRACDFY
jgi:hypothetical protein